MVFSRPLALTWAARMDRLVALDLASARDRAPHTALADARLLNPGREGFLRLCAAPDGPAWILAPRSRVVVPEELVEARWRAPAPEGELLLGEAGPVWRWSQEHAVIGCARHRAAALDRSEASGGGGEAPGSPP